MSEDPQEEAAREARIQRTAVNMLNDQVAEHHVLFSELDARLKQAVIDGSEQAAQKILSNEALMSLYWAGAFSQMGKKATEVGKDTLWSFVWGGVKKLFFLSCALLLVGSYFGWPFAVSILKSLVWKE